MEASRFKGEQHVYTEECSDSSKMEVPNYAQRASELKMILGIHLHELILFHHCCCLVSLCGYRLRAKCMETYKRVKQSSKQDGWHGTRTVQAADSNGQRVH